MWGMRVNMDRKLAQHIFLLSANQKISLKYNPFLNSTKGGDQDFLAGEVINLVEDKALVHDSFDCKNHRHSSAWPTQRIGNCFVGSPSPCNQSLFNFYECPMECRPKQHHQDWKFC